MKKLLIVAVLSLLIAGCAETSCTVAVRDSAAVIEIDGASAASECQALVDTGQFYWSEPQREKPLICVVEYQGLKYTVRDQGLLYLVGNDICSKLTE